MTARRFSGEIAGARPGPDDEAFDSFSGRKAGQISGRRRLLRDATTRRARLMPGIEAQIGDGVDLSALMPLSVGPVPGYSHYYIPNTDFLVAASIQTRGRYDMSLSQTVELPECDLAWAQGTNTILQGSLPDFDATAEGRNFSQTGTTRSRRILYIVPAHPTLPRIFHISSPAVQRYRWPRRAPDVVLRTRSPEGNPVASEAVNYNPSPILQEERTVEYAVPTGAAGVLRDTSKQPVQHVLSTLTAALSSPEFPIREGSTLTYRAPITVSGVLVPGHLSQLILPEHGTALFVLTEGGDVIRAR